MGWLQSIPEELRTDFDTAIAAEDINSRLAAVTRPPGIDYKLNKATGHMYEGRITATKFTLRRIAGMRALLPKLEGEYAQASTGTHVVVRTKLRPVVISAIGTTVGLLLPMLAIFLTVIIIGNLKIVMLAITTLIVLAAASYIVSIKNKLIAEFKKDEKMLLKLLHASDAAPQKESA